MRYVHYKSQTTEYDKGIGTFRVFGNASDPLPKEGDFVVIDASRKQVIKIEFVKIFDFSRRVELLLIAK